MTTTMRILPALLLLGLLGAPARAGERIDALRTLIGDRLTALESRSVSHPKAVKEVAKAKDLLARARDHLATLDAASGKAAFRSLGKGIRALEKAAGKEGSADFEAFAGETAETLWTASVSVFLPGDVFIPGDPDADALQNRLAKKLRKALALASKPKFGKAVRKLGKAVGTLLEIDPDP